MGHSHGEVNQTQIAESGYFELEEDYTNEKKTTDVPTGVLIILKSWIVQGFIVHLSPQHFPRDQL